MSTIRQGWVSVDDKYDGEDTWIGTEVELYDRGPYLGEWEDGTSLLRSFDGKHVRITVECLDG